MKRYKGDSNVMLPFAIDANGRESLTNQLANGLRKAIEDGVYRQGDRLPTWRQLADALGVSVRVPREAMRLLRTEGYVIARPRLGCVAAKPSGVRQWKGTVAVLCYESDELAYYMNRIIGEMRTRLARAGYGLMQVGIRNPGRRGFDFNAARRMLGFRVDLVVNFICAARVYRWLDDLGIPFVACATHEKLTHRVGTLGVPSAVPALVKFAEHCRAARVRRVLEVGFCRPSSFSVRAILERQGIFVEPWCIPPLADRGRREGVREAVKSAFIRRFGGKSRDLPDLIVLTDDVLAAGAFFALAYLNIDVPGDVRVVTLANEGDMPLAAVEPTCILNRPAVRGAAVARYVIGLLGGNASAEMEKCDFAYRIGRTFPFA